MISVSLTDGCLSSGSSWQQHKIPSIRSPKGELKLCSSQEFSTITTGRLKSSSQNLKMLFRERIMSSSKRAQVFSPNISSPYVGLGLLDSHDDEYNGVIIDPECLPLSANAFVSMFHASLAHWKLKGKKGIWLKIMKEQADIVPIAIKEGFVYHHAEPEYAMLTYWIPDGPCMLPDSPSHQIGIGGFVMNENKEVLVVKEKQCPCRCSGIWKLPTGFINKGEEIYSGAVREVKEETGIDTAFIEVVAFRHAHRMCFEKSDLFFVCMLKPLSNEIVVDEKEIEAAKWMELQELTGQPYYREDHMLKKAIDICVATHEKRYKGFTSQELISRFDGQLAHLYYNDVMKF